ncbi:hypothetical protein AB685_08705 [Bacillus sp. LL01]|uniref:hypothetical protein n=1 Tax=Bacillus sp. LL01 TaxID=1665556 RepID=UPI00064D0873|nr:hypothetical protein [Bacillus sp. LL01]KMJ59130.1 hypothetical protein AB685_08705 [Bacillus sp. LL01]
MKVFLDPTIYIIDTENDFYICTKEKNLKLVLNEASRNRVYQIIKTLKAGEPVASDHAFDGKILQLLLEKGMATTLEKKKEVSFDDIHRISGPPPFIEVLKRECGHKVESVDGDSFLLINGSIGEYELHVTFLESEMYISNYAIDTNNSEVWSDDYLEYAAHVFLEQLQQKAIQPSLLKSGIMVIDLSIYENTSRMIAQNHINYKNFKSSIFMNEKLNKGPVTFDFKHYFPFVRLSYQSDWLENDLVSIGFQEEDAINNLLQLLARHFQMEATIDLLPIDKVETEKVKTLLKKLWFIKFQQELEIEETNDSLYLAINKQTYSHPKTPTINPISYLLTLHLNGITAPEKTEELVR